MTDIASQFGAPPVGDTMRRMAPGSPFDQANQMLHLSPEEQELYVRHLQNLWGKGGVDNADGSRSTIYQTVAPVGSRFANIPTVFNGKILDLPAAIQAATEAGGQKGLSAFPTYGNADVADDRYMEMHPFMGKDTEAYQKARPRTDVLPEFNYPGR